MHKDRSLIQDGVVSFLVAALLLAGCSSSSANTAASFIGEGTVSSVTITDKIETSGNLDAGQLAQLTWGVSGIVDQVNVQVGQKVKVDDVLATLRLDSVPASMITAQADLANAKRNLEDTQNVALSQAQAEQNVLAARKAVEVAQTNYDALSYPRSTDEYKKNLLVQIDDARATLTIAQNQYREVQNHAAGDPQRIAAFDAMTKAQDNLNSLVSTYNYVTAKPTQLEIDQTKAILDVARANLEVARQKRDLVKNGADPLAVEAARAKVEAAQSVVNAMQSIAPFTGEIIAVQAISGNAVNKDDPSVAMVDRNTLKVDTQIDETSISTVKVGNPAEVTMESMPGVTLKGQVSMINPIGAVVNGLVKYTVTIALEATDEPLLFGATANVVIMTGEPHVSLAVPVNAVLSDNQGEYVLKILDDGSTQRVDVTSGDLIEASVTIAPESAGLKEGDKVQLGSGSSSSSSSGTSNNRNNNGGGIMIPGAGGPPGG